MREEPGFLPGGGGCESGKQLLKTLKLPSAGPRCYSQRWHSQNVSVPSARPVFAAPRAQPGSGARRRVPPLTPLGAPTLLVADTVPGPSRR